MPLKWEGRRYVNPVGPGGCVRDLLHVEISPSSGYQVSCENVDCAEPEVDVHSLGGVYMLEKSVEEKTSRRYRTLTGCPFLSEIGVRGWI